MKPFERWKYEEIELTFGTERVNHLKVLDEWLKADEPADDFERRILLMYHNQLVRKVDVWNKEELNFSSFLT
jgi:hypothetical protein